MATLIRTILTSEFGLPSPDPSGITFLNHTGSLLIGDGEVDEIDRLFTGSNVFESSLSGNFRRGYTATAFSKEVTGVSYNPANKFLYFSDDDAAKITQLNPGADGLYNTSDDILTSFSTKRSSGKSDSEDVSYSTRTGNLYIADGLNSEVFVYSTNGTLLRQFDTLRLGLKDPEGIVEDPTTGNLFMVGFPANRVFEITSTGDLVRTIDISAANALKPAGLTIAPNSNGDGTRSLYIVDRGVDNDDNPNENDGKIYEFRLDSQSIPTPTPSPSPTPTPTPTPQNQAPIVNAGADQVVLLNAPLAGSVTDDGAPSNSLSSTWRQISGAGTATFGNAQAAATSVGFSTAGSYVLELSASDGQLSASDRATFQVLDPNTTLFFSFGDSSGQVGGTAFNDEDILAFNQTSNTWQTYFDGSDVGVGKLDIKDFYINSDGSILLTLDEEATIAGVGTVTASDILKFSPTSTGSTTSGSFSMFFDGSDVGLESSGEKIDAFTIAPNGRLIISTTSSASVPGASGADEDLLAFNATSLGDNTAGTWTLYFDGSDVGLTDSSEDVDSVWIDRAGTLYLSTEGAFNVTGAAGGAADIFTFNPSSLGANTAGTFGTYLNAASAGISNFRVDGFTRAIY